MAKTPPAQYLARVCWNDRKWSEPAGVAAAAERANRSYVAKHRFGIEEWLFNMSRCVEGWHYGFLKPVQGSRVGQERGKAISVRLWSKSPDRTRWYIGEIRRCEVVTGEQSVRIAKDYERRGWLEEMDKELAQLRVSPQERKLVTSEQFFSDLFNVRFRPADAELYDRFRPVPRTHKVAKLGRYNLVEATARYVREWPRRGPATTLKATGVMQRRAIGKTKVQQEHNALQNHIYTLLEKRWGKPAVSLEDEYVDIKCRAGSKLHLIEVKSDPRARVALREAIGQLLDYAFFAPLKGGGVPVLHVAAPGPCTDDVRTYLATVRTRVGLVVKYHQVSRETKEFRLTGGE